MVEYGANPSSREFGPAEIFPSDPYAYPPGQQADELFSSLLAQYDVMDAFVVDAKASVFDRPIELDEDPVLGKRKIEQRDEVSQLVVHGVLGFRLR